MKKLINTKKAPAAIGAYSQAVEMNGMLFVSGQIPFIPETMELISEDVQEQTEQSLKNLVSILEEAGYGIEDVVKTTVFIKDMNEFGLINEVYGAFFKDDKPARACVEVARLPKDVKVEIDAIAAK